jgi:hypothetical protein
VCTWVTRGARFEAAIRLDAQHEYVSPPRRWHREGQTCREAGTQSHGPRAIGVAGLPKAVWTFPHVIRGAKGCKPFLVSRSSIRKMCLLDRGWESAVGEHFRGGFIAAARSPRHVRDTHTLRSFGGARSQRVVHERWSRLEREWSHERATAGEYTCSAQLPAQGSRMRRSVWGRRTVAVEEGGSVREADGDPPNGPYARSSS